jgi:hypothetical protein
VLIDTTSGLTEASATSKPLKRGTEDHASGRSVRFPIVRAQRERPVMVVSATSEASA